MNRRRMIVLLLSGLILFSLSAALADWVTEGEYRYYYGGDGLPLSGFYYTEEGTYYLDETGRMLTGFVTIDEELYYFGEDGLAVDGFFSVDGYSYYAYCGKVSRSGLSLLCNEAAHAYYVYYFDDLGRIQTGFQTIDGEPYYFDEEGRGAQGWFTVENNTYYASDGHLWHSQICRVEEESSSGLYCFDSRGRMLTGFRTIDGLTYYFGKDGKMVTGWFTVGAYTYYAESEFSGLFKGYLCVYTGERAGGYYFDKKGRMQTGLIRYREYSSGPLQTYYHDQDGKRVTGWKTVDGAKYYFNPAMCTGYTVIQNVPYYFESDGKLCTKAKLATATDWNGNKRKCYVRKDGTLLVSSWKTVKKKKYYFDQNGFASTGLSPVGSDWYYFSAEGVLQKGWVKLPDIRRWVYIRKDGIVRYGYALAGLKSVYIPDEVDELTLDSFSGIGREFYIRCEPGSYAEKFALRYGLQYDNGKKRVVGYEISDLTEKVNWIVSNYIRSGMSEREKALVLHNWLICNAHYDKTYSIFNPEGVLLHGSGVCQSYADAYTLLLTKAGLMNRPLSGVANNGSGVWGLHEWNLVRINGQWYHVDTTWDDPSVVLRAGETEMPAVTGGERTAYFLITDKKISSDHQWDEGTSADNNQVWTDEDQNLELTNHYTDKAGTRYLLKDDSTAMVVSVKQTAKKLSIPDTVTANNVTYRVTVIGEIGEMPNLKTVSIGKNISVLPEGIFKGCASLKTFSGGQGLKTISASAFEDCGALTSVTLCKKLEKIGDKAFYGCGRLKSIVIQTTKLTNRSVGDRAFGEINANAVVKCPNAKLAAYRKMLKKAGIPKTATIE